MHLVRALILSFTGASIAGSAWGQAGAPPPVTTATPPTAAAPPGVPPTPAPATAPAPTGGASAPPAAPPPPPGDAPDEMRLHIEKPNADAEAKGRVRNMDEFAEGAMQTVRIQGMKARYAMNFFGDVSFIGSSEEGSHPSFVLGAQNFLITGKLDDHFVATSEFAIEFSDSNEAGIDLERMHVGYEGEHFFVRAGRVHTELGYWNNAYHHGKWLSPSIERPKWVAFEDDGGLLPVHTVGLTAGFLADLGETTKLKTSVSVSNGRGKIVDDIRNKFDYQTGKALHGQIELIGVGLPDLRVGISGMTDVIPAQSATDRPALPDTSIREYIFGAHIAYPSQPVIAIAEGYAVEHRIPGHSFLTYGGYALIGYALGSFTPYVRGEIVASKGGADPFFIPDPTAVNAPIFDQYQGIVGLRFDLTSWTALRAEYRLTEDGPIEPLHHAGVLQWCWAF